jgi:hypothetical protein
VTAEAVLERLPDAETLRYDERGNRRAGIQVGTTNLMIVIDESSQTVITLWVE